MADFFYGEGLFYPQSRITPNQLFVSAYSLNMQVSSISAYYHLYPQYMEEG
jgi:hypothetical protein